MSLRPSPSSARDLLVQHASAVGFPAPAPRQGLMEWADEALDTTLTRGSPAWAEAHGHVLDALDAAMLGSAVGTLAALELARDGALSAHGRRSCRCADDARGHRVDIAGRTLCVKCGGRA